MTVLLALSRAGLRRRRPLLGLAALIALGLGVAIASLEASARTEDAYPSYLRRANVSELVVNPSLNTEPAVDIIASTPGVRGYVNDSLLNAGDDRDQPSTQAEVDSSPTQVRVSANGRYITQDRPVVRQGRMIRSAPEAFVNVEMADALHLRVGSVLPLAFYPISFNGEDTSAPVKPFGRAELRVVGIGVFQDEVLVDGLYPRHRVLITGDVGARYDCTLNQPGPDDPRPVEEIAASLVPSGCAMSYRSFSLRIDGGDRGVGRVSDALAARFRQENEQLPASLQAAGIGFELIPTVTADEAGRVRRSLEPAVKALQLFAAGAAVATIALALLSAMRIARRGEQETRIWRDLGADRMMRTAGVAAPLAVAALVGLAGSLVVGWLASGIGPVASARSIESAGRLGLSTRPVVVVVGASSVVLVAGLVLAAALVSRPRLGPVPAGPPPSRALARVNSPPFTLGFRAAVASLGSRALLAASITVVSAVLATLVFSASLSGLMSHPARFGWPYDIAATVNYGYGGTTDVAAVAATLDRPEVDHWGLAVLATLTIGTETLPFVAECAGFDALPLPVIQGELPVTADEIALGALTAKRLGLGVGDKTLVKTQFGEREARVRGLVVLPPVGRFQSDRASLGTGALLSRQFLDALLVEASKGAGADPGHLGDVQAGFVAVDLRPGVDRTRFLAAIADRLPTWDTNGSRPFVYPGPVRPATVANVAAMQAVPVLLTGLLALTMALGLMLAVAVAARARRRELAVLRALGCIDRQLRATVRWQALTVVGIGLLVGLPVGLAVGRTAYRAFANGLGIRPVPVVSMPWLGMLVAGTVAIGLVAGTGPGRRAARTPAGEELRQG